MGKMLAGKGIVIETTCGQGGTIADKVASGAAGREHHRKPVFSNLHTLLLRDTHGHPRGSNQGCWLSIPSLFFSSFLFFTVILSSYNLCFKLRAPCPFNHFKE